MAKKKLKKKVIQQKQGRDTRVCSCTGVTGTGKSYQANIIAKKLANNDKVLVITYAGSGDTWNHCKEIAPTPEQLNYKKGWRKIHFVNHASRKFHPLMEVYKHYKNGVIIFDDCRMYMKADWEHTPGLKIICNDHRHNGLDLIFVAHSPNHIPKQCWAFIHFCWVFKCGMKIDAKEMHSENAEKFVKAQNYINDHYDQEYSKNHRKPRGLYKYIRI